MELNLRTSIRSLVFSFLSLASCSYSDEITPLTNSENNVDDKTSQEKHVSVEIKFLGIEKVKKNDPEKAKAMKYSNLMSNEPIGYTQVLDGELGAAEIEKIQNYDENKEYYLASPDEDLKFLSNNANVPNEIVCKILAYKKNGNTYTFHKQEDFILGTSNPQMELDSDQNYTLLIVSTGTGVVPRVIGENDFESVRFVVNQSDTNTKILYQRIDDFTPNGNIDNNFVEIKLKNKTTRVRIILDASDIMGGGGTGSGRYITEIKDAEISYNRPKNVELRLHDSYQMLSSETQQKYVKLNSFGANSMVVASNFVNNIIANKNTEPVFSVVFKTDSPKEKNIRIVLKGFEQETEQTFRIKLRGCGAYLGPNKTNWKTFMCHNLGADYSRDPFLPSDKIHGDKYQWGMKYPIVKQNEDVYESPRKTGWNRNVAYNTWNRGLEDPCPSGWRLPTSGEWESVLNNNKEIKLGNWYAKTLKVDDAGVGVGINMMLPAAGKRFEYGNTINSSYIDYWHATMASVWTSTESGDRAFSVVVFKNKEQREQYEITRDYKKLDALPVRCIKID